MRLGAVDYLVKPLDIGQILPAVAAAQDEAAEDIQTLDRVEVTGIYWHFVDLVWIFLFLVFYLL